MIKIPTKLPVTHGEKEGIGTGGGIEARILLIRGHKVMLDSDLAELYGTTTKALNKAVKRNAARFPPEFMFRLSKKEKEEVVTNCDHLKQLKFSPVLPNAFTEHGALMVASVLTHHGLLRSASMWSALSSSSAKLWPAHKELAHKLAELEGKVGSHDQTIRSLVEAIRQLMAPPAEPKRRIGFGREHET